jgi:osmotically-inducible protein OsmY
MHKPNVLLESDVREQLDWDPMLDDSRVVVKGDDGTVTLTGVVETFPEVGLATDDVWAVGGVRAVQTVVLGQLNG